MESVAASPKTPRVEVRLLGGFEVRLDGRTVSGFESQKVRGLLAYLLVDRGTFHGRERLAELFWPDHEPAAARSSLRQALYNLRSTLMSPGGVGSDGWQPVVATHQAVSFPLGPEVWVDVEAFEDGLRRGLAGVPGPLDVAVQLYRGDFLSGCPVRAGEELDGWIAEQQERLREGAIQALRTLIAHHRGRGGPSGPGGIRLAIQHARRLLALDVLSEETHRQLMALYSASGRRGRALAQYEELRHRLDRELGVAPSEETDALYRAILKEEQVAGERGEGVEPVGPVTPLVGRDAELSALRRAWGAVQRGAGGFTLLEGEPGAGKSRLAKSFLSEAGKTAGAVLLARCQGFEPEVPYQPIRDALRNEVGEEMDAAGLALAGAPAELVAEIARLLPEVAPEPGRPDLPRAAAGEAAARDRLADAVWQVLRRLTALSGRRTARPVLLLLEDLHLADRTTLGLLERLLPRLASAPVMILATAATGWRAEAVDPLARLRPGVKQVFLDRLDDAAVREIARRLMGPSGSGDLARLFLRHAAGLPLAIAELTNLLADEGILVRSAGGGWTATSPLDRVRLPETAPLQEIVLRRLSLLPTSTRRLATLAAVLGHGFDTELLREVEREHATVVEHAIEVLLDRWLVRHATSQWHAARRESDAVLWANGARRGAFEFSHEIVRRTIYDSLNRTRRRVLHRQIAEVVERRAGAGRVNREAVCELLAYHYARAGAWDRTVAYLKLASDRALHLSAELPPAPAPDLGQSNRM